MYKLELGLLPGAMLRNKNLKFLCRHVTIRVENEKTLHPQGEGPGLRIPIAHFDGNYYAPRLETLREIEDGSPVYFRYCEPDGSPEQRATSTARSPPSAELVNKAGNVCGPVPT